MEPDVDLEAVWERYEASDRYDIDAIDWFAVSDPPAHIMDAIREWYSETGQCSNVVQDIADGVVSL